MRLNRPRAILFDWDSTLVDNWAAIYEALNATLVAMGHEPWNRAEMRARVRESARNSFPRVFGERWHEAMRIFYDRFTANHLETLTARPGAAEMLAGLAAEDIYLGVVSNKRGDLLRREAVHLNWAAYFARMVGAMDAAEDKPAVAAIELALAGSGIPRGPAIWFVGDAAIDVECARNAGCTAVLMGEAQPEMAGITPPQPDRWISGCSALAALVRDL